MELEGIAPPGSTCRGHGRIDHRATSTASAPPDLFPHAEQIARGAVVIDTDVYGADLVPGSALADRYEPLIVGRPAFTWFQTAAELRDGAMLRGWGGARMLKLEARIATAEVVHSGPDLIEVYAQLRVACQRCGHGLSQRQHNADRWIAAPAVRLGIALVSNDTIFKAVPGLELESAGGQ